MAPPHRHQQVLYETAMAIGNSLDLKKMLAESIEVYLRNFRLVAGAVLRFKIAGNWVHLDPIFGIPHMIHQNSTYQAAMDQLPGRIPIDEKEKIIQSLPITGLDGDMHYHIMELPDFGLLVLLKNLEPIGGSLLKLMARLNNKLAIACSVCLRQSAIEKLAMDLEKENKIRQDAEIALAESHERLLTILNSIDVLIYVADLKTYELIFTNRHADNLLEAKKKGKLCFEVVRGESQPCTQCSNDALLDPEGRSMGPLVWEDRNPLTRRWYIHQARAIKWIDGRWVRLQISTDITQLKQLAQERLKEAHLQQTQRLEALGILAGGVAHEYNNLLMSMLGNVSLINFKIEGEHPVRRHLNKIEEGIQTAANLTDKLLGYAQKGRYDDIYLILNSLIQSAVSEFASSHESIGFHLDLAEDLYSIEADQRQIEHVLWNLLSNAGDAMPEGGDLWVATRNIKRTDLHNKPYVLDYDDYVELVVRDSGVGMSDEIRNHIFDPFYTTKPMIVGKGAGLGMAATYGIIKAHGGFIEVNSKPGEGSEFIVYMPAVPDTLKKSSPAKRPPAAAKTVLWVDDDKTSLDIGTQILEHLGYNVLEADSGMEALAQYRKAHDRIDVVLLDIVMPEMGGIETFEQIKTDFPEAKILLASGYLLDAEARRLIEHGADGFVKKPFVITELHQIIEKVTQSPAGEQKT